MRLRNFIQTADPSGKWRYSDAGHGAEPRSRTARKPSLADKRGRFSA
jgi:hypothetical protein